MPKNQSLGFEEINWYWLLLVRESVISANEHTNKKLGDRILSRYHFPQGISQQSSMVVITKENKIKQSEFKTLRFQSAL